MEKTVRVIKKKDESPVLHRIPSLLSSCERRRPTRDEMQRPPAGNPGAHPVPRESKPSSRRRSSIPHRRRLVGQTYRACRPYPSLFRILGKSITSRGEPEEAALLGGQIRRLRAMAKAACPGSRIWTRTACPGLLRQHGTAHDVSIYGSSEIRRQATRIDD